MGLLLGAVFGTGVLMVAAGWRAGRPPPPLLAGVRVV